MIPMRREVQAFASDCERLLASYVFPKLTKDEKYLVLDYITELAEKLNPEESDRSKKCSSLENPS